MAALSPQWEYLSVLVSPAVHMGVGSVIHPKAVNGQELKNWKKIDLNTFLSQLGVDSWEMTGTINVPPQTLSSVTDNYLFFKRIKP